MRFRCCTSTSWTEKHFNFPTLVTWRSFLTSRAWALTGHALLLDKSCSTSYWGAPSLVMSKSKSQQFYVLERRSITVADPKVITNDNLTVSSLLNKWSARGLGQYWPSGNIDAGLVLYQLASLTGHRCTMSYDKVTCLVYFCIFFTVLYFCVFCVCRAFCILCVS